MKMILLGQQ